MPKNTTPPPASPEEERLESLERAIVKGQRALADRNRLIVEMAANGHTQADLTRRLNRVRSRLGAKELTPDALFVILKRKGGRESQ